MKSKLLFLFLLFILTFTYAQERKWNIETNYAVVPAAGFGGNDNVFELGLKYRFIQNENLNLGFSVNGGFFPGLRSSRESEEETNTIIQPRLFTELNLPFFERLRPTFGLGYSFMSGFESRTDAFGGFNLNLGLTYDIGDRWFIQFQYDRVGLSTINDPEGFNNFRLGIGFRF